MNTSHYTITIDASRSRGIVTFTAGVGLSELLEAAAALLNDPAWQDGFDEVWDVRGATGSFLSARDVQRVLAFDTQTSASIRRTAIVVTHFRFRMLALSYARLVSRDRPVGVFETLDEALAWLDAP